MKELGFVLENSPSYIQIKNALCQKAPASILVKGASSLPQCFILYSLFVSLNKSILVITKSDAESASLARDFNELIGEERAFAFPSRDYYLGEVLSQSLDGEHQRLKILSKLRLSSSPLVCFASSEACSSLTMPPNKLERLSREISSAESYDLDELCSFLAKSGYANTSQIEGKCQFARRGGILDVFPPELSSPVRIEFWGDEIDSMSYFSLETQRRTDEIDGFTITPSRETVLEGQEELIDALKALYDSIKGRDSKGQRELISSDIEKLEEGVYFSSPDRFMPCLYGHSCLLDYFEDGIIAVSEILETKASLEGVIRRFDEDTLALLENGEIYSPLGEFYLSFEEIISRLESSPTIYFDTFGRGLEGIKLKTLVDLKGLTLSHRSGELSILKDDLKDYLGDGFSVLIFAGTEKSSKNLANDLLDLGFDALYCQDIKALAPKKIYIKEGGLSGGFEIPELKLAVLTMGKLSTSLSQKKKKSYGKNAVKSLTDLNIGDYVVHIDHGIGIFEGVVKRSDSGYERDYLKIKYAGSDALYISVTQLGEITKYIAPKDLTTVKLDKLGSTKWQTTKKRVKTAVSDMAEDLLKLYAERMKLRGYAFSKDTDWQSDFESRFPYDETNDQLKAIQEIKDDMESEAPMDRLLLGDVGFGKTEVAIRAAFKCVMDSKQCAVLVPTTILAWQHYLTFTERMAGFPIRIELLSRFKTPKEQDDIISELRNGKVDIVIGTHRIVQDDVKFKDLGLCIIDEEQRFGVAHKEKFKAMRGNVDVLTLSATPIPRTLNMAMSGIRDMSTINEAPQDRQSVTTLVIEEDDALIQSAIGRELRRGGQVFYLHNKVASIERKADKLRELFPNARIETAHGKMTEEKLSGVWKRLVDGEIDILVCTTIIETGVDVPNCNTLVIEDADKMGLSQLYQLRGRVGRSSRRAFAYLLCKKGKALSDVASKRLSAIKEFTAFGSGFRIAMRDLEIRGAGNIIGAEQHGHMEAVGYEMYVRLLSEAIAEKKGDKPEIRTEGCTITLNSSCFIPESYISQLSARIDIYKKIAEVKTLEDSVDITDELLDRFGDAPKSVLRLIDTSLIRNLAESLGILSITEGQKDITIIADEKCQDAPRQIVSKLGKRVTIQFENGITMVINKEKGEDAIALLKSVLTP